MYVIEKQFIIGNPMIWVQKLNENDITYEYKSIEDANIKLEELKASDNTGREYRIFEI